MHDRCGTVCSVTTHDDPSTSQRRVPWWDAPLAGTPRDARTAPSTVWRRVGPLLGLVWIVFLSEPLSATLDAEPLALRVLGLVGVVGVAAVFAVAIYVFRVRSLPAGVAAGALALQTAFVAAASAAGHEHGFAALVFVGVTAVFLINRPGSLGVVALVAVALLVVPRVVPGWEAQDSDAVAAVLSGLAVYGFTQLVTRNRQLFHAQEQVASLAAAQERERLARDVHDIVGHSLTVVSVKAELTARLLRDDPDRAAAELADIQRLARSALADVRGLVTGTRTVTLAGELAAARSAYDAAGVEARLPGAVDAVAPERQELFAWALREATTNVLRHSQARHVVVTLGADALVVDDDGRGPGSGAAAAGGSGLQGLAQRARAAGATLVTGPGTLGGFRVAVRFS
jgi:two-component system sensor histidine kinase DesK